ncbi:MAG: hypothetical protein LBC39_07200 [Methanobrevibacter sp.]|jgi:hypothetical protein|nr:hypothetical protein [Candidatus Methanovirga aequatorialis]
MRNDKLLLQSIQILKFHFFYVKEILAGLIITTFLFVFFISLEEFSGKSMDSISLVIDYFQFNLLFIMIFIMVFSKEIYLFSKENKRKMEGKITWVGYFMVAIAYGIIISLIRLIYCC